jgi:type I restriction enzyme R subunit
MDKRALSERDICTKFITPALRQAGWDEMLQIREEVGFTKGRIIVRGKLVTRGQAKRADYILYYKPNIPLALIEAKDNSHSVGDGMQQGLDYASTLDIPFVFSSNGDGFVFHDRTGASTPREANLGLGGFPRDGSLAAFLNPDLWPPLADEAQPGNAGMGGFRHRSLHVEVKHRFRAARALLGQAPPAGIARSRLDPIGQRAR